MPDTGETLSRADDATLDLIKRDADAFLAAQLTVALAGNQRAMTFFGFLATASALIGGASITALATSTPAAPFAWAGLLMVVGFLAAMFLANRAALPDGFYYVGNDPENWLDDVVEGKSFSLSKAEALADSSRCINKNQVVLLRSAKLTMYAVWTAWVTLVIGTIAAALTAGLLFSGTAWVSRLWDGHYPAAAEHLSYFRKDILMSYGPMRMPAHARDGTFLNSEP